MTATKLKRTGTIALAFCAMLVICLLVLAVISKAQVAHKTTLVWGASIGATGYNVYSTLGPCTGTFNKINTTPVTLLTFIDTGQVDGEVRCYRVTALAGTAESIPSGTFLATTPTLTAGAIAVPPPGSLGASGIQ